MTSERLKRYMIIFLGLSMVLLRLTIAGSNIAMGIAILLFLVLVLKTMRDTNFGNRNEDGNCELRIANCELIPSHVREMAKVFAIFSISLLPSVIFSSDIIHSGLDWLGMCLWYAFPCIILVSFTHKKEHLWGLITVVLLIAILDGYSGWYDVFFWGYKKRCGGFYHTVMDFSKYLSILIPIVLVLTIDKTIPVRLRKIGMLALIVFAGDVFFTQSRGLLLSVLASCLIVLLCYAIGNKKLLWKCVAVVAVIGVVIAANPRFVARFNSVDSLENTEKTEAPRIAAWQASYAMLKDNPVAGVGLNNWREYYDDRYCPKEPWKRVPHAHNNFFMMGAETGCIGLAGYLLLNVYMLGSSFRRWWRTRSPFPLIVFCAWLGMNLFGLVDITWRSLTPMRTLWVLTGAAMALEETGDNERP